MHTPLPALACAAALALVAACDQTPETSAGMSAAPSTPAGAATERTPYATSPPAVPVPPADTVQRPASAPTARDTKGNDPTGTLTKEQESSGMPKAGQANNHSSPSLEPGKR
jgi:hypothetical protein